MLRKAKSHALPRPKQKSQLLARRNRSRLHAHTIAPAGILPNAEHSRPISLSPTYPCPRTPSNKEGRPFTDTNHDYKKKSTEKKLSPSHQHTHAWKKKNAHTHQPSEPSHGRSCTLWAICFSWRCDWLTSSSEELYRLVSYFSRPYVCFYD